MSRRASENRAAGRADLGSHLPLAPATFEILLALVDEPLHGYAIMQSVAERSARRIELLPGTLYRKLARLAEEGVVEVDRAAADPGDDPRRRYYVLTSFGRRLLEAEVARLADQVSAARKKKLLPRPGASS